MRYAPFPLCKGTIHPTVPVMITRHFKLKAGDMLQWEIKAKKNDKFEIIVTPVKKKRNTEVEKNKHEDDD